MPLVAERRGSVEGGRICSGSFSDSPILATILRKANRSGKLFTLRHALQMAKLSMSPISRTIARR